jgi:hypothetical protein
MKNTILLTAALLVSTSATFARNITPVTVQGDITTNTHWTNDKQYLLKGSVYVDSNATLTIDSGVTVFGDKATKGTLIIERGAKIYANGTKKYPVIFTSNENPASRDIGDWGGLVICGKCPTNWQGDHQVEGGLRSFYGGNDPNDNSGRLSYVRIEFGGIAFSPDNEVNSLSLYAVGSGTQIDHVQCSYNGDDAIEWFGGTVNAKYLVTYKTVDDDFDNDLNFSGKVQFGLSVRAPYVSDGVSGSKGMESDAYQGGTYSGTTYLASMANTSVWSNITWVGPQKTPGTSQHNSASNIAGIQIRRGSGASILNSIVLGWPVGLLIDESSSSYGSTVANITSGSLQFRNNIIAGVVNSKGPRDIFYVKDGARNNTPVVTSADTTASGNPANPFNPFAGPYNFLLNGPFGNRINPLDNAVTGGLNLTDPFNAGIPNPMPATGSPALSGADFTNNKASDTWFTPTSYVGGFGTDNWLDMWTEFSPVNANYDVLRGNDQGVGINNIATSVNQVTVYPNPAANFAVVTFNVTERTKMTVGLYDITGKQVAEVLNGEETVGTHSANIDLSNVPAGYYMVRIATAAGQQALSLVVTK